MDDAEPCRPCTRGGRRAQPGGDQQFRHRDLTASASSSRCSQTLRAVMTSSLVRQAGPPRPTRTCRDRSRTSPSGPRAPRRATAHGTFISRSGLPRDWEGAAAVRDLDPDPARRPRQQHGGAAAGRGLHGVAEQFAEDEQDGLGGVLVTPSGRGGPGGVPSQCHDGEVQGKGELDAALLPDLAALLGATAADRDRRCHGESVDQDGDEAVRIEEHMVTGSARCSHTWHDPALVSAGGLSVESAGRRRAAQEPG